MTAESRKRDRSEDRSAFCVPIGGDAVGVSRLGVEDGLDSKCLWELKGAYAHPYSAAIYYV
jgi:hypothetical protein